MYKQKFNEGNEPRISITYEFIELNNLTLNRSMQEIVNQMKADDGDFFGHKREVLFGFLDYKHGREFLTDECKEKHDKDINLWQPPAITDIKEAAQDFLDYMVFAWMKAEDEKGLSAGRSLEKLSAWLWVMGREDLSELIQDHGLYNPYGAPALIEVCNKMKIKVPDSLIEFSKHKC